VHTIEAGLPAVHEQTVAQPKLLFLYSDRLGQTMVHMEWHILQLHKTQQKRKSSSCIHDLQLGATGDYSVGNTNERRPAVHAAHALRGRTVVRMN